MFKDINYNEVINCNDFLFIDVRSPNEFEEATIPGAINIPLFNNEERTLIGTIYKTESPEKATEVGLELVSPKIPTLIKEIKNSLASGQKPVFFCRRGGMRSRTVATLYQLVYPKNVYRLSGGYRAYREYILEQIANIRVDNPTFVLHGMTGVGKTILLDKLKDIDKKNELAVIDLEGLAGHRGSIFGGIGDINPVNQKKFDSRIYELLINLNDKSAIVLEAESKRVGKVLVPDNIMLAKENGYHILVSASIEKRIERIIADYKPNDNKEDLYSAFIKIARRLPTEIRHNIDSAFKENDFCTVVKLFLIHYYDPKYQHSTDQYQGEFIEVNSDDLDNAVDQIYNFIDQTLGKTVPLFVRSK